MILGIQPVPAYPSSGVYMKLEEGRIELESTASFLYTVLDTGANPVSLSRRVSLTLDQYNGWTGADTYVAANIAVNAGLTPISGFY